MLAVVAMFFVSCHKEDPTPTQEVHLTQTYSVGIIPTGDTALIVTMDYIWENNLLKRTDINIDYPSSGSYGNLSQYIYTYNGTDCIEDNYISSDYTYDMYFTYSNGRMTNAYELRDGDTLTKTTIHSYTAERNPTYVLHILRRHNGERIATGTQDVSYDTPLGSSLSLA